jgi:hypothetical protein
MVVPERDFSENFPVRLPTDNSPSIRAIAGPAAKSEVPTNAIDMTDLIKDDLVMMVFLEMTIFEIITAGNFRDILHNC